MSGFGVFVHGSVPGTPFDPIQACVRQHPPRAQHGANFSRPPELVNPAPRSAAEQAAARGLPPVCRSMRTGLHATIEPIAAQQVPSHFDHLHARRTFT